MQRVFAFLAARKRLVFGIVVGLLAYPLLPRAFNRVTSGLCAWDLGVVCYILTAVTLFCTEPQSRIAANARAQEEGEWTIFWVTMGVVGASLVAVLGEFAGTKDLPPGPRGWHVALVVVTLLASWLATHIAFAFRYAHEYYTSSFGNELDRGLEFPGEKHPDYLDFAYFSLVLGMTFQVSDVQVTSRALRRLALIQGVLSFLFNTVIVALTVNIAASLL